MKFVANRDDRIKTIHFWHLQVHQGDVGAVFPELLDSFASIGRLGDQSHVRLTSEKGRDPFADKGVIVDRQNPD